MIFYWELEIVLYSDNSWNTILALLRDFWVVSVGAWSMPSVTATLFLQNACFWLWSVNFFFHCLSINYQHFLKCLALERWKVKFCFFQCPWLGSHANPQGLKQQLSPVMYPQQPVNIQPWFSECQVLIAHLAATSHTKNAWCCCTAACCETEAWDSVVATARKLKFTEINYQFFQKFPSGSCCSCYEMRIPQQFLQTPLPVHLFW